MSFLTERFNKTLYQLSLLPVIFYFSGHVAYAAMQFEDVTSIAGPFGSSESWGVGWGNFNRDGFPDFYMSKHRAFGSFYQNNGDGSFSNKTLEVDSSRVWQDDPHADSHGYTWADFDNDGDDDLFGAVSPNTQDGELLVNQNGSFILKSRERNLYSDGRSRMGIWFDYDNDGLLDISIPHNGFYMYKQNSKDSGYFLNDENTGLDCTELNNYGQLIDIDGGGGLELICAKEGAFPHKVYEVGSLPFRDVTSALPVIYNVNDTSVHDFDGDLRTDIVATRGRIRPSRAVVVNSNTVEAWLDSGKDTLKGFKFKSDGAITFKEYSVQINSPDQIYLGSSGDHPASVEFTVDTNLVDEVMSNIGAAGLYIGYSSTSHEWTVLMQPGKSMRGYFVIDATEPVADLIMINDSVDEAALMPEIMLNKTSGFIIDDNAGFEAETCVSVVSGDFDNDTDVDIYMVCRYGPENIANVFYENQGNGKFKRVVASGAKGAIGKGLESGAGVGESAVVVDYNADGYLDLFVTNGLLMQPEGIGGEHQLFKNTGSSNHWIQLDLIGRGKGHSNRNGIGAKIYATANGKTQLREQNGGYHRWSQNHQRIHFGLGLSFEVDLRIEWPSGHVDHFEGVASDKIYKVREGGKITVFDMATNLNVSRPVLSIESKVVEEDSGVIDIRVGLSSPAFNPVIVSYINQNGTALKGRDFKSVGGTLTFNAGESEKFISVPVIDDDQAENAEQFTLALIGSYGTEPHLPTSTVTILDNDSVGETGLECEAPTFNSATEPGLYAWKNCITSQWFVKAFGGGLASAQTYDGAIESDKGFSSFLSLGIESNDILELSSTSIEYTLQVVGTGLDEFEFSLPIESNACIYSDDATNQYIKLGKNKINTPLPFNLEALAACDARSPIVSTNEECGRPSFSPDLDEGIYLWRDCDGVGGGQWHFIAAAGGSQSVIQAQGNLSALIPFLTLSASNLESTDEFLATFDSANFQFKYLGAGIDGFDFTMKPGNDACLKLTQPINGRVILGANNIEMYAPFNILDKKSCK